MSFENIALTDDNFNRPTWTWRNRLDEKLKNEVITSLSNKEGLRPLLSFNPEANIFKSFIGFLVKRDVTTVHKQVSLAIHKFIELISLEAKRLSQKETKKRLKKLLSELKTIEAKDLSEKARITALNESLEKELQESRKQVAAEESDPKIKKIIQGGKQLRLSKRTLEDLLKKLGLKLSDANNKKIEDTYKDLSTEKDLNPQKFSTQEWEEIEQAYLILSEFSDNDLQIIADSQDNLTPEEGKTFLHTLNLNPETSHSIEKIDVAYNQYLLKDDYTASLFQNFINQTDGFDRQMLIDIAQLFQPQFSAR
jgi:hypothetical protein